MTRFEDTHTRRPRVRGARRKEDDVPIDMPSPPNLMMELLCLLSPRPQWIDDLADDLGISTNEHTIRLCKLLKKLGYGVEIGDSQGFQATHARNIEAAWISLPDWQRTQQRAQKWWDRSRNRQEVVTDDNSAVG